MRPRGIVTAALLAAACGGATTDQGAAPVPRDQFADKAVAAICDNIATCCQEGGFAYDRAGCAALLHSTFAQPAGDPTVGYDARAAGACIDALAASARACADFTSDNTACTSVFAGTAAPGSPCTSDVQCAAPAGGKAYCGSDASGALSCVAQPRGKAGDACVETCTQSASSGQCYGGTPAGGSGSTIGATCYTNDGLYCDAGGACAPLAQIGASCTSGGCVAGATCNGGACVAKAAVGQACTGSDACVDAAYCTGAGVCASKQERGTACQTGDECTSGFCDGTCATPSIASSALCAGGVPTP